MKVQQGKTAAHMRNRVWSKVRKRSCQEMNKVKALACLVRNLDLNLMHPEASEGFHTGVYQSRLRRGSEEPAEIE